MAAVQNGTTFKPTEVNKLVEPLADPHSLLLVDRDPFGPEIAEKKRLPTTEELLARARDNTQFLFNKIWQLPLKIHGGVYCAELPEKEEYRLPREKPVPPKQQLTKWESFAKSKGIKKQPKSKKVYDEATETWKPTFGYRRANDDTKDWIVEVADQKDPYKDYFAERVANKKERVAQNELHAMKNQVRAESSSRRAVGGRQRDDINAIPLGVGGRAELSTKDELTKQMSAVKTATASAGKFQPAIKGEKKAKTGTKRKFDPNETNVDEEKEKQLKILGNLGKKKPKLADTRVEAANHAIERQTRDDDDDGDESGPRRGKLGSKGRGKSNVHRQQYFNRVKKGKSGGGGGGKGGKGGAKRGGGGGGKKKR